MVGVGVNDVPIVGEPMAYGIGFIVLLLVLLTGSWAGSLVTVVHEGGHMTVALLTFRGHSGFSLNDGGGGGTNGIDSRWGLGWILTAFAGYATPPLVALGAAGLVANGNPWAVLWAAIVLFIVAFVVARNPFASLVALLVLASVVYVAIWGTVDLQAAVAVGLAWWLLFGALRAVLILSRGPDTDPDFLYRSTLVPRIVWHAIWVGIALVALIVGAQLLLRPGYGV